MTAPAILDSQAARTLTDRIKVAVEGTWLLIQDAYTSRAWDALGYDSWDAYCSAEFGASRLRLPREERQEVVASLRESGLSTRAIASATGMDQKTVRNDLAASGEEFSSPVTGADGKSYAATRPQAAAEPAGEFAGGDWLEPDEDAIPGQGHVLDHTGLEAVVPKVEVATPAPVPAKAKRRPLPEAFADAGRDLKRAAEQLARLAQDDRFTRNRDITHHQMPDLLGALENTAALLQAMNLPQAAANEEARRWWATSLNTISDALTGVAQTITKENN